MPGCIRGKRAVVRPMAIFGNADIVWAANECAHVQADEDAVPYVSAQAVWQRCVCRRWCAQPADLMTKRLTTRSAWGGSGPRKHGGVRVTGSGPLGMPV
eukprot:351943-Chlamydomonas_euryale.AAC.4